MIKNKRGPSFVPCGTPVFYASIRKSDQRMAPYTSDLLCSPSLAPPPPPPNDEFLKMASNTQHLFHLKNEFKWFQPFIWEPVFPFYKPLPNGVILCSSHGVLKPAQINSTKTNLNKTNTYRLGPRKTEKKKLVNYSIQLPQSLNVR